MEDLINKAGRQRMLCERMVKSYVQVVSGVAPRAAAGELAQAIGVFERQLAELKVALAQAEARARLAELERVWQRFRLLAALP
ncbi:MAG TPA: type IV pili methyl-accepting chemotaxis transducer N-terminal domain-containing protein, partial [Burkholderiales bacterium]